MTCTAFQRLIASAVCNVQMVQRPLMLSERMVALAAAVSVDYDYFSQQSHGSGWFAPMMFPPVPYPSGGGAEGGAEGVRELSRAPGRQSLGMLVSVDSSIMITYTSLPAVVKAHSLLLQDTTLTVLKSKQTHIS